MIARRWSPGRRAGDARRRGPFRDPARPAGHGVVHAVLRDDATTALSPAESEASRRPTRPRRPARLIAGAAEPGPGSAAVPAGAAGPTPSAAVATPPAPTARRAPPQPAAPTTPAPTTPAPMGPAPTTCVASQPAQVLGAGSDHAPIGVLQQGATYQVLGTAQGWVHVRGEGLEAGRPLRPYGPPADRPRLPDPRCSGTHPWDGRDLGARSGAAASPAQLRPAGATSQVTTRSQVGLHQVGQARDERRVRARRRHPTRSMPSSRRSGRPRCPGPTAPRGVRDEPDRAHRRRPGSRPRHLRRGSLMSGSNHGTCGAPDRDW